MILIDTSLKWDIISSISAVVATIIAIFYTYYTFQLLKNSKETLEKTIHIQGFQIYIEIGRYLDTADFLKIFERCQNNTLNIDYDQNGDDFNNFNSDEINRKLLNPIEDIAVFYELKLISIKMIDSGFGYKILKIGSTEVIKNHILKTRKSLPNAYSGYEILYEDLYKNCTSEDKIGYSKTLLPK